MMETDAEGAKAHFNVSDIQLEGSDGGEKCARSCHLTYSYKAGGACYDARGVTGDFSKRGCGIRGTVLPPSGTQISLTLHLSDQEPLTVDGTVMWTVGDFFEVQFVDVAAKDYT